MSSERDSLIDGLEAIEAGYRAVAVFPLETLSRSEGQALRARLDKLNQQLTALDRKLAGRMLTVARDHRTSA
ncbi:MAG: hypothetical protein QOD39_1975 [Mycobacterium sp.]|jgi:hypothetical protein|nr:hypothetical protein [Mycobacterium sp.]